MDVVFRRKMMFFLYACLLGCASLNSALIQVPNDLGPSDCADNFHQERLGDYPFPTEMSFRKFCDHEISCTISNFDPEKVGLGDTVFVMDWYIPWFLKNVHPKIRYQYILITGDSSDLHPWWKEKLILYDTKIGAWFSKNLCLSNHPKLFATPCGQGISQSRYTKEDIEFYLGLAREHPMTNKIDYPLVYMSFNPINHASRSYVKSLLLNKPFCCSPDHSLPRRVYQEELSRYKFTVAPKGQAPDTMRFWEAIGLNTIPVIEHSPLDSLYEGTPSVIVKNWEEVTEEFLLERFEEIQEKVRLGILSAEKAYFPYWKRKIEHVQKLIRNHEWSGADLEAVKFDDATLEKLKTLFLRDQQEKKWTKCSLLVYGKLLGLRAFQLSNALPQFEKILYADEHAFRDHELIDRSFKESPKQGKLVMSFAKEKYFYDGRLEFVYEYAFPYLLEKYRTVAMFMDLTHYKYNFTDKLVQFFQFLPGRTMIVGNMASDPYVQMLLRDFALQKSVLIETDLDLWYMTR